MDQSSTPSTSGGGASGTGKQRNNRSIVCLLTGICTFSLSRAAGRPPSSLAMAVSLLACRLVRRAWATARSAKGSAKVLREQAGLEQKNRRTWTRSTTAYSIKERSARLRVYLL